MNNAPQISGILHISDLHLGENLDDCGTPQGEAIKAIRSIVKKGGVEMQAHDPYILATIKTNVQIAARELRLLNDEFDFVVVSGDISTAANNDERFDFARQFLTGSIAFDTAQIGLEIKTDSLICVPGNHDKMGEQSLKRYLAAFSHLPDVIPYVKVREAKNGLRFAFYGIDSNLYEEGNVAIGHISERNLSWLSNEMGRSFKNEDGIDIRILVLHHHPCDLNRFRRKSIRGILTKKLTRLEGADRLLDICKGWINIILHGHEHFPISFRDERSKCIIVSGGTLSQFQKYYTHNNFNALIFSKDKMKIVEYEWTGGRFRRKQTNESINSSVFDFAIQGQTSA
jgi:3',5'-cyclic AMP phosphodiesterase CpdA